MARTNPKLTLTEFIDVASKSGIPRATALKHVKFNDQYSPVTDFYKALREHVVETHRTGQPKAHLKTLLTGLTDAKKQANYPAVLSGYQKWWGKQTFTWFKPPSTTVNNNGVEVSISPELGLVTAGQRYIIKLYLRGQSLPQNRADLTLRLMESSLKTQMQAGDLVGIVDAKRGKMLQPSSKVAAGVLDGLLLGEFASIAAIWPTL
jgi:hypothetical protein